LLDFFVVTENFSGEKERMILGFVGFDCFIVDDINEC
jgi:hypothetical protein